MSLLDDLISVHCPAGVPFVPLGQVAKNHDNVRKPVTKHLRVTGQYPYYGANGVQDYVDDFLLDGTYLLLGEDGSVMLADGTPVVNWANGKIWVNNHAHVLSELPDGPSLRFFFHFLQTVQISHLVTGSAQPKLNQANMNRIRVPVPPVEVQSEIVRVLDLFTAHEAELEAELEARRTQYLYYRDLLCSFEDTEAPTTTLAEAGAFFGGLTGKTKVDFVGGDSVYVPYMNIFSNLAVDFRSLLPVRIGPGERQYVLKKGDVLFTGSSESRQEAGMTAVVAEKPSDPLFLNSFSIGYRLSDPSTLDPQFAKHLFRSGHVRNQIVRAANGVTRFNVSKSLLGRVRIPIPPMESQLQVATTLNHLHTLVNDLSSGLPAEIAARRKQYEHYRERLLTFKELEA